MVTFAVSGLWHGASWNFVIWGAINGLAILPTALRGKRGLTVSDVPGGEPVVPSFSVALRILLTFGVMCLAWVFFRAETLAQSFQILNGIWVGVWNLDAWHGILAAPSLLKSAALVSGLVCVEWIQRAEPHPLVFEKAPRWQRWMVYTVLLFGALTVSPGANTPFIYFQF